MNIKNNQGRYGVIKAIRNACLAIVLTSLVSVVAADERVSVSFDKALLETPTGIERVYKKLKIRVRRACELPHSVLNDRHEIAICKREMLAEFVNNIGHPSLNRIAQIEEQATEDILYASK